MEEAEEPKREFRGFFIPVEVLNDQRLNGTDKLLLAEIDALRDEGRGCFAKNKHLAKRVGVSESRVANVITKLRKLGYVETLSFDGRERRLLAHLKKRKREKAAFSKTRRQSSRKREGSILVNENTIDKSLETNLEKKSIEKKGRRAPISKQAALLYGQSIGLTEEQVDEFFDHHTAAGWMLTKGRPMVDGEAALRTWKRHAVQFAARDARGGALPLDLKGKSLDALDKMKAERTGKLSLLRRKYGDKAIETGAVGKQMKRLQAELREIRAATNVELDKLERKQ